MQANHPPKRYPKLTIAIPGSLVSDVPHLREKTFKIGLIGRALAIFRVDEIIVFPDFVGEKQNRETDLIATILSYMETPQYLRKLLFKITPELSYAGVLPPLRTPHHPLQNRKRELKVGEFREGVVVRVNTKGIFVEIGVEQPVFIFHARAPTNARVTVKIVETGKEMKTFMAKPEEIETYWGYKVKVSKIPLGQMLNEKNFDLAIATSRYGNPIIELCDGLSEFSKNSSNALVAFGSPTHGLQEIVRRENLNLKDLVDFVVNTIPDQATETVRTEEAVIATLASLNLIMRH